MSNSAGSNTYSDYSETQSETDYDSYTSTPEDLILENINNGIDLITSNKNILKDQLIQPIKSISFRPLFSEIEINDSFELCLLRFIHLVFSEDQVINFTNLKKFMDTNTGLGQKLYEYFVNNPGVMQDHTFYYSNAGIDIRTKWYELLSNINTFKYKSENHQMDSTIENLFEFFKQFFPKLDQNGSNNQEKLTNIYTQLNFNFESFEVIYSSYQKIISNTIHLGVIQNISINSVNMFVWEMTRLNEISSNPDKIVELFVNSEFLYS